MSTRATFTSFSESTQDDWSNIMVAIQHTQSMVADRIIDQMSMLGDDYGGFPVSRLEHCLQTATRAQRAGENDEYVLCSLIHDIGDNLAPLNHPSIAAGIVKPFVNEANHWMVLHHGIFQGYYFWHHIGLDRNTRDQFVDSPFMTTPKSSALNTIKLHSILTTRASRSNISFRSFAVLLLRDRY